MVKVVFTFDVPEEKQAEFLKLSREGTKPYWEAHGALSYDNVRVPERFRLAGPGMDANYSILWPPEPGGTLP